MENPEKNDEFSDKIEVFSSDDDKLKSLGELLSNESSRKLFLMLTTQEMSASEISEKINLGLSSVIHHLNKMQQVGIVKVSKIVKNTKNHDMKYYSAKQGIMILPSQIAEKAKKSKSLINSVNRISRFVAIGISGVVSWAIIRLQNSTDDFTHGVDGASSPDVFTFNASVLVIPLIVILIGLIIERIHVSFKNRSNT